MMNPISKMFFMLITQGEGVRKGFLSIPSITVNSLDPGGGNRNDKHFILI